MRLLGKNFLQASVTKHVSLCDDSVLVSPNGFSTGILVVGRVIRTSEQYGHLETANSTMHKLSSNDIVVGALGNRAALRGHTGHLPKRLSMGAKLSLLNIGGVIGELSSSSSNVGVPVQLEFLGATRLSIALHADTLILLSNISGLLQHPQDPKSRIPRITNIEAQKLLDDGSIRDGMRPKVESVLNALQKGVTNIHLADGRQEHVLCRLLMNNEPIGTHFSTK